MKVLVASGAFKDLYSPIEACEVIAGALGNDIQKEIVCFCDGGEYTYDILKRLEGYREITVDCVLNPYLQRVCGRYLVTSDTAHIISSEIIRLYSGEEKYKNPLYLSDYGLGQLLGDAIDRGYKRIYIYIGGTSTVCAGMGMLQALGVIIKDKAGNVKTLPVTGKDLVSIGRIDIPRHIDFSGIEVMVIADGDARSFEMSGITELKIGDEYKYLKEEIIDNTNRGIKNIITITGLSENMPFSGAAGGLAYGLDVVFKPKYMLGGEYFAGLLNLEEKIQNSDIVITGEGRYDNTACGKTPVSVARFAKKYNKRLVYVCGMINDGIDRKTLKKIGIDTLLSCYDYYGALDGLNYEERLNLFKTKTPDALRDLFRKIGL